MKDTRKPQTSRRLGAETRHWITQRISAVGLALLGLWFMAALACLDRYDALTLRTWLAQPWTGALMALFALTGLHHAASGLQVVIGDYVHTPSRKLALLLLVRLTAILAAASAILSILSIVAGDAWDIP